MVVILTIALIGWGTVVVMFVIATVALAQYDAVREMRPPEDDEHGD
jgi:hypothetical protein